MNKSPLDITIDEFVELPWCSSDTFHFTFSVSLQSLNDDGNLVSRDFLVAGGVFAVGGDRQRSGLDAG